MSKKQLCLLNSICDAQSFLSHSHDLEAWHIYAMHHSVVDYLKTENVECQDISVHLTQKDYDAALDALYPKGTLYEQRHGVLAELDAIVPQSVCQELGLKASVPFFSSTYDYYSHVGFWGKQLLSIAIGRAICNNGTERALVYSQEPLPGLFSAEDVVKYYIVPRYDIPVDIQASPTCSSEPIPAKKIYPDAMILFRALMKRGARVLQGLGCTCDKLPRFDDMKNVILLLPEYDFYPLLEESSPFNIVKWFQDGPVGQEGEMDVYNKYSRQACSTIAAVVDNHEFAAQVPKEYIQRIVNDLLDDNGKVFRHLALLEAKLKKGEIDCAVWGNSPGALTWKNAISNYLLKSDIPVIGGQHGGNYGAQDCGYGFALSDYKKCTHFFSYGFDKEDVKDDRNMPASLTVVPVGSTRCYSKLEGASYSPKSGRVLFPITNCFPVQSTVRISPFELARRQKSILGALDEREDLDVWIKPFVDSSSSMLAWGHYLQHLKHAKVANAGLPWFLKRKRPELVVIEFPSSPLFEILPLDVDIFLMFDPVLPFNKDAEESLRRRAHVFETEAEIVDAILQYKKEPITRLRDDSYYRKYIWRPNAKKRMVDEVERIIKLHSC